MRGVLLGLVLAGLAGCADTTYSRAGGDTVDISYTVTGYRFARHGTGTVWVFVKALDEAGKVKLCGAYSEDGLGIIDQRENWHTLGMAVLYHRDVRLIHGINFMHKFDDHTTALGQPSNCVVADIPWQPVFADEGLVIRI